MSWSTREGRWLVINDLNKLNIFLAKLEIEIERVLPKVKTINLNEETKWIQFSSQYNIEWISGQQGETWSALWRLSCTTWSPSSLDFLWGEGGETPTSREGWSCPPSPGGRGWTDSEPGQLNIVINITDNLSDYAYLFLKELSYIAQSSWPPQPPAWPLRPGSPWGRPTCPSYWGRTGHCIQQSKHWPSVCCLAGI